jgi:hypothetical protein
MFECCVQPWLLGGQDKESCLCPVVEAAMLKWQLPEDATMGKQASYALDAARRSSHLTRAVSQGSNIRKVSLKVYDDVKVYEAAPLRTGGEPSIIDIVGKSMVAEPSWRVKLAFVSKNAKAFKQYGPTIQNHAESLEAMTSEPSADKAKLLGEIMDQIPMYNTVFLGQGCLELEQDLLTALTAQCVALGQLLATRAQGDEKGAFELLAPYNNLLKKVADKCEPSEAIDRAAQLLKGIISKVGDSERMSAVVDAMEKFDLASEETVDCLVATLGNTRVGSVSVEASGMALRVAEVVLRPVQGEKVEIGTLCMARKVLLVLPPLLPKEHIQARRTRRHDMLNACCEKGCQPSKTMGPKTVCSHEGWLVD